MIVIGVPRGGGKRGELSTAYTKKNYVLLFLHGGIHKKCESCRIFMVGLSEAILSERQQHLTGVIKKCFIDLVKQNVRHRKLGNMKYFRLRLSEDF